MNAIVTERLNRERAKYADYNDLKAKAEQCDAVQAQLDELNRAAARKEMLARVTAATGCPAELLTEETEEACTAQAKAIMKFAKPESGIPKSQRWMIPFVMSFANRMILVMLTLSGVM